MRKLPEKKSIHYPNTLLSEQLRTVLYLQRPLPPQTEVMQVFPQSSRWHVVPCGTLWSESWLIHLHTASGGVCESGPSYGEMSDSGGRVAIAGAWIGIGVISDQRGVELCWVVSARLGFTWPVPGDQEPFYLTHHHLPGPAYVGHNVGTPSLILLQTVNSLHIGLCTEGPLQMALDELSKEYNFCALKDVKLV